MALEDVFGSVLGLGGSLLGGLFGGSSASKRRRALTDIANTPGLALADIYGDSLGAMSEAMPQAQDLVSRQNRFNQSELDALLEGSVPGLKSMQGQRAGNTASFLRGELPEDVASSVYRGSIGRALEGGFGGSTAGRNLTARDLGRTSLDLMRLGGSELDSSLRSAPLPSILSSQDLLSIGPQQTLGLRSGERSQRISGLQQAAGSAGSTDVWSRILQDLGGNLFGSSGGFGSILGG